MIFEAPPRLGAVLSDGSGCGFRVWAPAAKKVDLHLYTPRNYLVPMEAAERGYFQVFLPDVKAGARYKYLLDNEKERPDPASRLQPEGVHGPSEVISSEFPWEDQGWRGLPRIDSSEEKWLGPGSPIPPVFDPKGTLFVQPAMSFVLLERNEE